MKNECLPASAVSRRKFDAVYKRRCEHAYQAACKVRSEAPYPEWAWQALSSRMLATAHMWG